MADNVLEHRQIELTNSLTEITIQRLLDDLKSKKVFCDEEVNSILKQNLHPAGQARCLINSVIKKGCVASHVLFESLKQHDKYVYDKLNLDNLLAPNQGPAGAPPGVSGNVTERDDAPAAAGASVNLREDQQMDTRREPNTTVEYKMRSRPRSFCVIINNVNFLKEENKREGSEHDRDALKMVFTFLGFDVHTYEDQSAEQIKELMLKYSKNQQHGDCFVCCVLSHGNSMGVIGSDDTLCPTEDIFDPFNGEKCPSLVNKPKVFFIQACRGSKIQKGITVYSDDTSASDTSRKVYYIPKDSDFLIARSTVEGYASFRSEKGSWFIQSLCRHLKEGSNRGDDILTILTRVNDEVSRMEGNCKDPQTQETCNAKATPVVSFTLRKKLMF